MRNSSLEETATTDAALSAVAALLPPTWRLGASGRPDVHPDGSDAVVDLVAPDGQRLTFAVAAIRAGSTPATNVMSILQDLRRRVSLPVLFVSDYIGPSLRSALALEDISFADATGWVRVTSTEPLILLTGQGAARSPRPARVGAVTRLNGAAVNRLMQALTTAVLPLGVRELAHAAEVSPGSASKLLATLVTEGIVERDDGGAVFLVRRRALIRRWVQDYSFSAANPDVGAYIAPRGLPHTLDRISSAGTTPLALTGSAAARRLLPSGTTSVVPLRLLAVYAARPATLASELTLIEADTSIANVLIGIPQDPRVLSAPHDPLPLAPAALVLADLLTLPNRSDAEAEQLMNLLARDDDGWRE